MPNRLKDFGDAFEVGDLVHWEDSRDPALIGIIENADASKDQYWVRWPDGGSGVPELKGPYPAWQLVFAKNATPAPMVDIKMASMPDDSVIALTAAALLRILARRVDESVGAVTVYPSPKSMSEMATALTNLADLYDRG